MTRTAVPTAVLMLAVATIAAAVAAGGSDSPTTIAGHPALSRAPRHTVTTRGHRGDPVNIAFVGTEEELHRALAAARWYAADPITLKSSLRIAADVVLRKPYDHAPVSDLFLWGGGRISPTSSPWGRARSSDITFASGGCGRPTTPASRSGWEPPPSTSGWRSAAPRAA